jgi:hypothetical protein
MKESLVSLARELGLDGSVRFFGQVPVWDVPQIMANSDLGVVPKRADSFGNEAYSTKIMEFMAVGVPVVVSSTRIDRYYFDDSLVRFFESGNSDALAEAMLELMNDSGRRRQMAARAANYAAANSWQLRKRDYLDLVDALIAGKRAPCYTAVPERPGSLAPLDSQFPPSVTREEALALVDNLDLAAQQQPWIKAVHRADRGFHMNFGGEIEAFYSGYDLVKSDSWDYIVKLDCDLSLRPDYFGRLFARLSEDRSLGIASGVYLERRGSRWCEVGMPAYHAAGASKVLRRECFEQIGGFIKDRGWDTIDEIRAAAKGWKTAHFRDVQMNHLKPEGSENGWLWQHVKLGEVFYLTGGSGLLFVIKLWRRLMHRPVVLGSLAMLWGYLKLLVKREPPLVSSAEAKCYRALLYGRIVAQARRLLQRG